MCVCVCVSEWSPSSCYRVNVVFVHSFIHWYSFFHFVHFHSHVNYSMFLLYCLVSEWRTATSRCYTTPSLTNTSCTCMTVVCCRWSSPTAASGSLAPAKTTCWTPGARRTVLVYSRCVRLGTYTRFVLITSLSTQRLFQLFWFYTSIDRSLVWNFHMSWAAMDVSDWLLQLALMLYKHCSRWSIIHQLLSALF